jgi:hypothetical protein
MTDPVAPLVRVPRSTLKRVEQRNTEATGGTERRNTSGTPDLQTLAARVLARTTSGTSRGTGTESEAKTAVPPPRNLPPLLSDGICPHIPAKARRHPANVGRTIRCAACFLVAHPNWRPRGCAARPPEMQAGTPDNGANDAS